MRPLLGGYGISGGCEGVAKLSHVVGRRLLGFCYGIPGGVARWVLMYCYVHVRWFAMLSQVVTRLS